MAEVQYGVPQDSILDPMLYIIFINDLADKIMDDESSTCHLYADDTAITITAANNHEQEHKLKQKFQCTKNWMAETLLTLNASKTKMIFFGTSYSLVSIEPPIIESDNNTIEAVGMYKYLGVILDSWLTFTHHLNYVRQKSIS